VLNRKGATFRKLRLKEQNPSDDQLFDLLLEYQSMIKRPLIQKGERYWVGAKFDARAILQFLES